MCSHLKLKSCLKYVFPIPNFNLTSDNKGSVVRMYLQLTCEQSLRINSSIDMSLYHILYNVTFFLLPHSSCQNQITFICNMLIPVIECSFLLTSQPVSLTPSEEITKSYETQFTCKCSTASAPQLFNITVSVTGTANSKTCTKEV